MFRCPRFVWLLYHWPDKCIKIMKIVCSELVVLAVLEYIVLYSIIFTSKTSPRCWSFPFSSGEIELEWWTKINFRGNLVHKTSNDQRDYKLVPSRVHGCQIQYKQLRRRRISKEMQLKHPSPTMQSIRKLRINITKQWLLQT